MKKPCPAEGFTLVAFLTKKNGSKFVKSDKRKIKAWAPKYPKIIFTPDPNSYSPAPWHDGTELWPYQQNHYHNIKGETPMSSTESKYNLEYHIKTVPARDFGIAVFLTKKDGSVFNEGGEISPDGESMVDQEELDIKAWAPKYPAVRFFPLGGEPRMTVDIEAKKIGFQVAIPQGPMPWKEGEELTIKLSVDGVELDEAIKVTVSEKIVKFEALDIHLGDSEPKNRFSFKVAKESLNSKWTKMISIAITPFMVQPLAYYTPNILSYT